MQHGLAADVRALPPPPQQRHNPASARQWLAFRSIQVHTRTYASSPASSTARKPSRDEGACRESALGAALQDDICLSAAENSTCDAREQLESELRARQLRRNAVALTTTTCRL